MTSKLLKIGGALVVVIIALGFIFGNEIQRARMTMDLFSGAEQYDRFNRVHELFPSKEMPASSSPRSFVEGDRIDLPEQYTYKGNTQSTQQFLEETDTSALLVLKDGKIRYENYWLTGGRGVNWLSMSVAKSWTSALVGIAVEEGHIKSINDQMADYVPLLKGSAYDGATIKDVLQMSSGAGWNEDYSDPDSDINKFGKIFAFGGDINEFTATLTRKHEPGTVNYYNSMDTQALGMLLVAATGQSVTDYMTEKLWSPLNPEFSGYWLADSNGMEMTLGGLALTARDYAKIGELYRNGGKIDGKQIVPAKWVKDSVTALDDHVQPNETLKSFEDFGYGYQWWLLPSEEEEYSAIGVYNQFIFVNPKQNVVIVKLSANSDYGMTNTEESYREVENLTLFRTIVDQMR